MRVAELVSPHRFRVVEQAQPEPGPGEVQVRVSSVGICGSDLHNFSEGSVGDSKSRFPMVLGHEPAGTVVKCGSGVTGWSPGDPVLVEPACYCYHCEYCRAGNHNVCANLRFLSQPGIPGFFSDYVTVQVKNLLPLPAGLSMPVGTLFEPLAVILHSMRLVSMQLGETAAVFGAGPIGLLTIITLKLNGASRVWAVEPVAHRRQMARAAGADAAMEPSEAVRQILADTGKRGVDLAIDCAAKGESSNDCLRVVRAAGRVALTGIHSEIDTGLNLHEARRKEVPIICVRRSNHESELAVELLCEQKRFSDLVTHTRPLDEIEKTFFTLESYADGVGKVVMDLASSSAP